MMEPQEETLESLKTQRGTIKGKLTRIYNFVQNYNPQINNIYDVKARQAEAEKIAIKLDELQCAIEMLDDGPERATVHEQERISFEDKYFSTKVRMEGLLALPAPTSRPSIEHDQLCTTLSNNETCSYGGNTHGYLVFVFAVFAKIFDVRANRRNCRPHMEPNTKQSNIFAATYEFFPRNYFYFIAMLYSTYL